MRRILKEIALAAWLPTTAGALTFATTWLVWFVTAPDCVPTPTAPCPKLPWGMYITTEVLGDCYIHTFLAMSVTGGSDVMLFIREFRNREKDQARHEEEKKIADVRLEQEQARSDRMMTITENMMQQAADRAAAAEARAEARLAAEIEERREERAAAQADRQLLADAINALNDRNNRRRPRRRNLRNGNGTSAG